MTIALCTLVLNEMEWLPKLYEQHKDWPDLKEWVFVEAADRVYAETNPSLVSDKGLSVDGTSDFLSELAAKDDRVQYIPYGFSRHHDKAMGKVNARQQYLYVLESVRPNFLLILDADEFYMKEDQYFINMLMQTGHSKIRHFCFQFTHIWCPSVLQIEGTSRFHYEVVGGFWDMRHTKGVRWGPGLEYTTSHQRPEVPGHAGKLSMYPTPSCIHMAFACNPELRKAKNDYYRSRGEAEDRRRKWYCDSRAAFEVWRPDDVLPRGAMVQPYTGPIPECFQ